MPIATIDDIELLEASLDLDPMSLGTTWDLLSRSAERHHDQVALSFLADARDPETVTDFTYDELLRQITAVANALHALGVTRETVVAYCLPNLPQTHFALWGAETAGIALAINPALAPQQILSLLAADNAEVLITTPALLHRMSAGGTGLGAVKQVLLVDHGEESGGEPAQVAASILDFAQACAAADSDTLRFAAPRPTDASSHFCTGGTTGAPKIAMRSHHSEVANAHMAAAALGDALGPGVTLFCGLPLFHVNAAMITGLMAWLRGARVLLGPAAGYRSPGVLENFWRIVAQHRVNIMSGVPTIYSSLLQHPLQDIDVSSLRMGICGAAPMPRSLMSRFESATGVRILEGYGLTEGGCVSTLNPVAGERRAGSIGLRLPGQAMRVAETSPGGEWVRDCEDGEVGDILICGPNIFEGYRDSAHNASCWPRIPGPERWFNTGDLGYRDQDGYYWLAGRRKELIIRGGHNIDPKSIEEPLHRHPAVRLAAAVGRPDAHAGEIPVAYVEADAASGVSEAELLAFAAEAIGERAAVPRYIRIIDAIPLTAVGKIFKPALVMREISDIVQAEASAARVEPPPFEVIQHKQKGMVVRFHAPADPAMLKALAAYNFELEQGGPGADSGGRP